MATESIYNNVYINDPEKAEKMIVTLEKAKEKAKHLRSTSIEYNEPHGDKLKDLFKKCK